MTCKWATGVTTVSERFDRLLPRTLASLRAAGFDKLRLFIDGVGNLPPDLGEYEVTRRVPRIRTAANWVLSAYELYLREPNADRYAIFQDDFVTYPNLRQYLEKCDYPKKGYLNLYTFPENEKPQTGWYLSNQLGKGAVALIFDNETLRLLLSQRYLVDRPLDIHRGHRAIDGGIIDAMKKAGCREYVHNPSLVQHTGIKSSMGNRTQELATTFRGESFDALSLLDSPTVPRLSKRTSQTEAVGILHTETEQSEKNLNKGRIGLVGFNCNTGLGELNRQIATYGDIRAWMVKPHPKLGMNAPHPDVETIVCPNGTPRKLEQFFKYVDTVVFCENPLYTSLIEACRNKGKRIVCIPMMEWMTPACRGWPKDCNLFLCPTTHCYEQFKDSIPCVDFNWPIDTDRFAFKQREKVTQFLFINGHGGWEGRKGAEVVKEAKKLWPEMPLLVRSQKPNEWPKGIEFLPEVKSNANLYDRGDVLLVPHSVDGLGLEPLEAMACGMPVISTDGRPWNEFPSLAKIEAKSVKKLVRRPVDWYSPSPGSLVEECKRLLGTDISEQSRAVREWAESRSWSKRAEEFVKLVRGV